jgi:hypothetical protein
MVVVVGRLVTIAGLHLGGLATGQLFLYGIVVGVAGMLGLSMLLGNFSRQVVSRRSPGELTGSQAETHVLLLDRERARQLADERAHRRAQASPSSCRR